MGRWSNLSYPALSQRQREYVLGAMLGDDSLVIYGQSINAHLATSQSLAHKPYLFWKYSILENLTISRPRLIHSDRYGRVHRSMRFRTRTTPELTQLYRLCYPNGKKSVSAGWLKQLSAFSLAVWYMDDGTYAPGRDFCMLYTGAFPYRQQVMIQRYLHERWGITGCVIQHNRRQWCLRFTRLGTQQLLSVIEPCIKAEVPSMLYKLGYPERKWTRPIQDRMNGWLYAWTPDEDGLLQQQYGYIRAKFIAERLDRSVNAIRMRARKLGLDGWHADQVSDGQGSYLVN